MVEDERGQAKRVLEKEVIRIESFQRLDINKDFEVFKEELINKKIEILRDLLETAKDDDLPRIRGQLEALRGVITRFRTTIDRAEEVHLKLKELD